MQPYHHIDPHVLLAAAAGDAESFTALSHTFLRIAPPMLERLQQAVADGDRAVAMREAHSLKSTAALVGAERLTRLSEEIESRARHADEALAGMADELVTELACVMDEVRASIAQWRPGGQLA